MFSGIIAATSKVTLAKRQAGSMFLSIQKPHHWQLRRGDSVAVNGACLTVAALLRGVCSFELMPETLRQTSFGKLAPKIVNLERPVRVNGFLDGHIVQGHIDTVGKIILTKPLGRAKIFRVRFLKKFKKLVVLKGSVTLDGVSLTVSSLGPDWLEVSLVDFTLKNTIFGNKRLGEFVNIEFDIIGKYVLSKSQEYGGK